MQLKSEQDIARVYGTPKNYSPLDWGGIAKDEWRSAFMWSLEAANYLIGSGRQAVGYFTGDEMGDMFLISVLASSGTALKHLGVEPAPFEEDRDGMWRTKEEGEKWTEDFISKTNASVVEEVDVDTRLILRFPGGPSQEITVRRARVIRRYGTVSLDERETVVNKKGTISQQDVYDALKCIGSWSEFGVQHGMERPSISAVKVHVGRCLAASRTMTDAYLRLSGQASHQGPIPPNKFAFNGQEIDLQPKDWEAINALWDKPRRTLRVGKFGLEVWGDQEPTKGQLDGVFGRVNRLFNESEIPFSLSKSKTGFVTLEDLRPESV